MKYVITSYRTNSQISFSFLSPKILLLQESARRPTPITKTKNRPKLEKYHNMQNVDPRTYFKQKKKFHWWIKPWRLGTSWVSFRGIPMWCHWSLDQSNYLPDVYVLQRKHNEGEVWLSAEIETYFGIVNSVWKIDMKDPQVDPKSPTSLQARPTSENKLSEGKKLSFWLFFVAKN